MSPYFYYFTPYFTLRESHPAGAIAVGRVVGFPAGTQINPLTLSDGKTDRYLFTGLMVAIAKGQAL
jgi:hypothetical protein